MSWGAFIHAFVGDDPLVAAIAWPLVLGARWFVGAGFYRARKARDAARGRP